MTERYIGLMSGTSIDAIDCALIEIHEQHVQLLHSHPHPIPDPLKQACHELIQQGQQARLRQVADLDQQLGLLFADAVNALLQQHNINPGSIRAIGSHGQTIYHQPDHTPRYSIQIGDPNQIAEHTGITTVADFRRRDMAAGGQGAPLVPPFHQTLFQSDAEERVVVNIGGIANVTHLPATNNMVRGWDTGPGNTLLDAWSQKNTGQAYDQDAVLARQGQIDTKLLNNLLEDEYFKRPPPKSSGREYFNLNWLQQYLDTTTNVADVQMSLCALTAQTVINDIKQFAPKCQRLLVCGGGVHNPVVMELLQQYTSDIAVESSEQHGFHPDWIEAAAFAWLAYRTLRRQTGNLASVTGAENDVILGGVYYV